MKRILCLFLAMFLCLGINLPFHNEFKMEASSEESPLSDFEYSIKSYYNEKHAVISSYVGDETKVVIPQYINGAVVHDIKDSAFADNTKIKEVIIPNGVETIASNAFSNCKNLESVVIPYTVRSIGKNAFSKTALKFVGIPAKTTIETNAFSGLSDDFTIYSAKSSKAESYAKKNSLKFQDTSDMNAKITLGTKNVKLFKSHSAQWVNDDKDDCIYTHQYFIRDIDVSPKWMVSQIQFSSNDKAVVTTTSFGKLYSFGNYHEGIGDAKVKVYAGDTSKSIDIEVVYAVEAITLYVDDDLDVNTLKLKAFEEFQLRYEVQQKKADNDEVIYSSSDEKVAIVNQNGVIRAISKGKVKIYATAADGCGASDYVTLTVTTDGEIVTDTTKFESEHNYANDSDKMWFYKNPYADGIKVTFNSKTYVEEDYDYIFIYDEEGNEVGKYTGDELAGKTISVEGNTVKVRIVSDGQGTGYGFRISKIVETDYVLEKPTDLEIKSYDYNSIKISWDEVDDAENYQVYRATSKTGKYTKVATIPGKKTYVIIDSLTYLKTYYFKVRAYVTIDDEVIYSSFSQIVSEKPNLEKTTVVVKSKTYNAITIQWDKVDGAQKYQVYRNAGNGYVKHAVLDGDQTSFTSTKLTLDKEYSFKVRAARKVNTTYKYSSFSDAIKDKTKLEKTTLSLKASSNNKVKLSWDKIDGATYYQVYRSNEKEDGYTRIKTVSKSNQSFEAKKPTEGKYYYKVRGYRSVSGKKVYSSFSNIVYTSK